MKNIRIHFYRGTRIFSRLIQWRTFSEFSHVSIEIDGIIYEAKEWKGVVCSVAKRDKPRTLVKTIDLTITNNDEISRAINWLKKQDGLPYDYAGILLFAGLPKRYIQDKKWFCSELAACFLWKLGIIAKPRTLLSPGALYLMIHSKHGTIL